MRCVPGEPRESNYDSVFDEVEIYIKLRIHLSHIDHPLFRYPLGWMMPTKPAAVFMRFSCDE